MLGSKKPDNDGESTRTSMPPRHHDAVLRDRVELLYGTMPLSLSALVAVAAILFAFHAVHGSGVTHWHWLGLIACAIGLRGLSAWVYRNYRQALRNEHDWLLVFRIGVFLAGVAWGVTGVVFYPADNDTLQVITLLVLAGVTGGALSTMGADTLTYRLFTTLTLSPACIISLSRGGQLQISIGLLVLLMLVFLFKASATHAQSIVDSLTLRYENAGLIDDLEREKRRLVTETETIMGTVLSCAPIALWAVDNDGVIRFMDGNHLEQGGGLHLPRVGENLFDTFGRNRQLVYETRRALRGDAFITEVEVGGRSFEVHYSPLPGDDDGLAGAIGVAIDVSERKNHEQELTRRAHYDELTGLPNRSLVMNQMEHAFENAKRQHRHVALFFLDLDNFKAINDTMGHKAGDKLLQQTADRLRKTLRDSDMPARLGGDEFVVVSENLQRPEDAEVVAHKIASTFQKPFLVDNREIFATTSVGIAVYPEDGATAEQLLQSADTAMYHAKSLGKNSYRFFTSEMQLSAERHLAMETELRRALQRGELTLLYQPKIQLATGRIQGAEALLRWQSPTLGQVPPDEFIPVAELAGLMPQIGDWVLRVACQEAAVWQTMRDEPVHIAINVSPQQFRNTDLLANVTQGLASSGLPRNLLELEITESVLVQDAPETLQIFHTLADLDVSLSLDDFGTGYSSLSYLKKFPLQVLKIDRAFVRDLGRDPDDDSLVDAIIAMAHSLRMKVVAEGVETAEQCEYLKQRGVELGQGYYFSKPLSKDGFRQLLHTEADGDIASVLPWQRSAV